MQNTLQKELLDLIQQTTSLLKEGPSALLPTSQEDYNYFIPLKKPTPEIQKPIPQIKAKETKPVNPKQTLPSRWSSIRLKLQKIAPQMKLLNTVLDDRKAQKIANAWNEQTEVVLITGSVLDEELAFLKDLARAIYDRLTPIKLISGAKLEKEKCWESFFKKNNFRLILLTQSAQKYTGLMLYIQQTPIPIITLESVETYKQPDQKTALWKSLCQILTPAVSSL